MFGRPAQEPKVPPIPAHLQPPSISRSVASSNATVYQRQSYQPSQTAVSNFCYDQQKNKPQGNSVSGAFMVMLVSGLHIGWGVCCPQLRDQEWHRNSYPHEYIMVILSWYIGAVLGSLLTIYIYPRFTKRQIYYCAGTLCVISSGLFLGLSGNAAVLIIARFLAGVAHGFAYITGISHASDNCVKEYRGTVLSVFHYMILMSACTVAVILPLENDPSNTSQTNFNIIIGCVALLYSLMALAFVPCLTFESIVYLIQRQQYREAIDNMIKLRNESQETWDIKNDFDEMKLMVAEDLRTKRSILKDGNTRPFLLILLAKIVTALGFNYTLNMIRVAAVAPVTTEMWAPATVFGLRTIVNTFAMFLVDVYGRKKLFFVSALGAGASMLVYGIIHASTNHEIAQSIPIFAFEIFAGIGLSNVPDVIMGEAFPITKKILSNCIASVAEYALQILFIAATYQLVVADYLLPVSFTVGALLVVIAVFMHLNLPETRAMSLRQARCEFRKKYDEVTFNRASMPPHINHY